jgi:hypothetical protein
MSSSAASLYKTAERMFQPLINENIFKNLEELLQQLMIGYINQQIKTYQKQINKFEKKHLSSFEEFTLSIKGRASWKDEDEWLDWEDATLFLNKWKKMKDEVLHAAVE